MSCCTKKINRLQSMELLARIVGWDGSPIVALDIDTIFYDVVQFHEATGEEVAVDSGTLVALTPVADYIHDTLQLNDKWTEDNEGYNFHFIPSSSLFAVSGQVYLVRVTFTPADDDLPPLTAVFYLEVR